MKFKPMKMVWIGALILGILIIAGFVFLPKDQKEDLFGALFVSFFTAGGWHLISRGPKPKKPFPEKHHS